MITILGYIYPLLTLVLPTLILFFVLKRHGTKDGNAAPAKKLIKILIFTLYIYLVFTVTGAGTIYEIGNYPELIRLDEITWKLFDSNGGSTYILNIIMCVPFGFLVPLIWKRVTLAGTIGSGFLLSFMIEASQLLNRRNSAVDDLLMNTIGAAIGYLLYLVYRQVYRYLYKKSPRNPLCRFLAQEPQVVKYEHLLYVIGMFAGHFLLYNWRGYIVLFYDYYFQ